MPNYVTNRLVLTGSQEDLSQFVEAQIIKNEKDEEFLDFNRVIPKPEALEDPKGASSEIEMAFAAWYGPDKVDISKTTDLIDLLQAKLLALETYLTFQWVKEAGVKDRKGFQKYLLKRNPRAKEMADRMVHNLKHYGSANWYDWAVKNWGTKWNAAPLEWGPREHERIEFLFDTAWSPPEPIFLELSRLYQGIRFDISSFDDGWNFACDGYYIAGFSAYECGDATRELYEKVYGEAPEGDR